MRGSTQLFMTASRFRNISMTQITASTVRQNETNNLVILHVWILHKCFFQVYVPYCTSDGYSGRRDASDETGGYAFLKLSYFWNVTFYISKAGYAFHGKIVVEAVITDLLDQVHSQDLHDTAHLKNYPHKNQGLSTCFLNIVSDSVNVDQSLKGGWVQIHRSVCPHWGECWRFWNRLQLRQGAGG